MSKEIRKVAQMLVGISSEYLAGTIEEDVFKVQIEFANDILNKSENLPHFVYRLCERGKCRTFEIGENDNPRTRPQEWCDRRVCEGFWGDEEMCKRVVSLLNRS